MGHRDVGKQEGEEKREKEEEQLYISVRVLALVMKSLRLQSIVWLSRDKITIDLYDSFWKVNICDAFLCGIGFLSLITVVFEQPVRYRIRELIFSLETE